MSPINSLFLLLLGLAALFLIVITILDESDGFALKRDWRNSKREEDEKNKE